MCISRFLQGMQPLAINVVQGLSTCIPTGHNYIGTEHILLGLLREGEGVAARVMETLGADPGKIRTAVSLALPKSFSLLYASQMCQSCFVPLR